ncbi:hypothetical protein ASF21_12875 [Arthrobacter sp. Leaf234]|uniref:DUF6093 family protein n=1 Tax=Arthrobacter sp. Leaf234 TaxID=1736303 RepID=UPI0006FCAD8B|nr:DUF6093 family protein [Arthrobacter sp. Leaf234]KQN99695.1 hypothetical protein ASF21_12875 [Arthrobacter sp. Leaf234]
MSPLPGYQVMPPGWAARHRPVAAATMQSPAVFRRISGGPAPYPAPKGWDGSEDIWGTEKTPVLVRVQQLNREGTTSAGEQPTSIHQYLVTAPVDGPPIRSGEQGDVIDVEGRCLSIINEAFGTYLWERDFTCVDNLTQQNPD